MKGLSRLSQPSHGLSYQGIGKRAALSPAITSRQRTRQMDAAEVLDQVKATVGATLKVTDTLPEPKTGASEKGGAGIAVTGKGRMQENSESANPKATPVRQPEVRKGGDELGG